MGIARLFVIFAIIMFLMAAVIDYRRKEPWYLVAFEALIALLLCLTELYWRLT